MIIVCRHLFFKGYNAVTLYPFIVLKHKQFKKDSQLMNHERIHLKQQLELLTLPFYVFYGIEFIIQLLILKDYHKAYKNISFEREAYANEHISNYLNKRPFWAFLNYYKNSIATKI